MAVSNYSGLTINQPIRGIQFTKVTDTSADWASVANDTYFYDKGDKLIHYKDPLGNILEIFSLGMNSPGASYGLFAQTTDSIPVTNTLTESSLIDGGVGTLTVPANGFKVGDSFSTSLSGIVSSLNNDGLTIRVKSNGVILGTTVSISMPATTNKVWALEIHFTIRSIGGPGVASLLTTGAFTFSKDASNSFEGGDFSTLNNTTFDTTITNTLNITAQWSVANPGNSIYTQYFTLNKIF